MAYEKFNLSLGGLSGASGYLMIDTSDPQVNTKVLSSNIDLANSVIALDSNQYVPNLWDLPNDGVVKVSGNDLLMSLSPDNGLWDYGNTSNLYFRAYTDVANNKAMIRWMVGGSSSWVLLGNGVGGNVTVGAKEVAPAPTNVVMVGTKVVGEIDVDPTATDVKYENASLPIGSILRQTNSTPIAGKKFLKFDTGVRDFTAIPPEADAAWGWAAGADDAWAILQAK